MSRIDRVHSLSHSGAQPKCDNRPTIGSAKKVHPKIYKPQSSQLPIGGKDRKQQKVRPLLARHDSSRQDRLYLVHRLSLMLSHRLTYPTPCPAEYTRAMRNTHDQAGRFITRQPPTLVYG